MRDKSNGVLAVVPVAQTFEEPVLGLDFFLMKKDLGEKRVEIEAIGAVVHKSVNRTGYARHYESAVSLDCGLDGFLGRKTEGDKQNVGRRVCIADLDEQNDRVMRRGAERDFFEHFNGADDAFFSAAAGAVLQVSGQDLLLQAHEPFSIEQQGPILAHIHFGKRELGGVCYFSAWFFKQKPKIVVEAHGKRIAGPGDDRKPVVAEKINRRPAFIVRKIEFNRLGKTRKVDHHEYGFVARGAHEREDVRVVRRDKSEAAPGKGRVLLTHGNDPLHPPEHGGEVVFMRLDIDGLIVIFGVDYNG